MSENLDELLQGLITPPAALPAADLNAVVGPIAVEAVAPPVSAPEFHVPTPDELAAFPPPPDIVPGSTTPPPPPPAPVFPQATVMGDKSAHSGLVVGHVVQPPKIIADTTPAPPKEIVFDDLPEKTKSEIRAGWLRTHGSMDDFHFGDNNTPAATVRGDPIFDPVPAEQPATPDLSKLSAKTRAELEAGARRLAQRRSDYQDVLDKVAASNASKHDAGGGPFPSNMDYAKGG